MPMRSPNDQQTVRFALSRIAWKIEMFLFFVGINQIKRDVIFIMLEMRNESNFDNREIIFLYFLCFRKL